MCATLFPHRKRGNIWFITAGQSNFSMARERKLIFLNQYRLGIEEDMVEAVAYNHEWCIVLTLFSHLQSNVFFLSVCMDNNHCFCPSGLIGQCHHGHTHNCVCALPTGIYTKYNEMNIHALYRNMGLKLINCCVLVRSLKGIFDQLFKNFNLRYLFWSNGLWYGQAHLLENCCPWFDCIETKTYCIYK